MCTRGRNKNSFDHLNFVCESSGNYRCITKQSLKFSENDFSLAQDLVDMIKDYLIVLTKYLFFIKPMTTASRTFGYSRGGYHKMYDNCAIMISDTHYSSDEHTVTAGSILMRPHVRSTFRK